MINFYSGRADPFDLSCCVLGSTRRAMNNPSHARPRATAAQPHPRLGHAVATWEPLPLVESSLTVPHNQPMRWLRIMLEPRDRAGGWPPHQSQPNHHTASVSVAGLPPRRPAPTHLRIGYRSTPTLLPHAAPCWSHLTGGGDWRGVGGGDRQLTRGGGGGGGG
jgi:hypothetical protein